MIEMPSNETQYTSELRQLFGGEFDIRVGAVLLGGFMLGHGDHLGALSMQYISPGVCDRTSAPVTLLTACIFHSVDCMHIPLLSECVAAPLCLYISLPHCLFPSSSLTLALPDHPCFSLHVSSRLPIPCTLAFQ